MKKIKILLLFILFIIVFGLLQISPLAKRSVVIEKQAPLNELQQSCLDKYKTLDRKELLNKLPPQKGLAALADPCSPNYACAAVVQEYKHKGFPFTNRQVSQPGIEDFSCSGSDYLAEPVTYVLNFMVLSSLTVATVLLARRLRK